MATKQNLELEDLILSSRSFTLEAKQELLKKLDTLSPGKKVQLREILEKEFDSFRKLDEMALSAIRDFSKELQMIAVTVTV